MCCGSPEPSRRPRARRAPCGIGGASVHRRRRDRLRQDDAGAAVCARGGCGEGCARQCHRHAATAHLRDRCGGSRRHRAGRACGQRRRRLRRTRRVAAMRRHVLTLLYDGRAPANARGGFASCERDSRTRRRGAIAQQGRLATRHRDLAHEIAGFPTSCRACVRVHARAVPGTRAYRRGRLSHAHAA